MARLVICTFRHAPAVNSERITGALAPTFNLSTPQAHCLLQRRTQHPARGHQHRGIRGRRLTAIAQPAKWPPMERRCAASPAHIKKAVDSCNAKQAGSPRRGRV